MMMELRDLLPAMWVKIKESKKSYYINTIMKKLLSAMSLMAFLSFFSHKCISSDDKQC